MTESRRELLLKVATVVVLVAVVSALHYSTRTSRPVLHDVYRRLYYLPVGLAAVWFGAKGGLLVSGVVALAYAPHIVLQWHHVEREVWNQFMEVGLYFVFAGVTGYFADRERQFRRRSQEAAVKLSRSYRELRRQADQILEIEDQLHRADRLSAMGQLAAAMTHEVRNPLGAIQGTAEILREDFPPGHPKAEFLEILLKETNRLNRVVEEFLGYARPHSDTPPTEQVPVDALLEETGALVEAQARAAGVELRVEPVGQDEVVGSPTQLKQVLLNLLLNAVQATPRGGTVSLRARVGRGHVPAAECRRVEGALLTVTVEDEGPGIPEELRSRVFDAFFTTRAEGTGLGLAISQRIARALGGSLEVENRAEGGARFALTLPLRGAGGEHDA